MNIKLIFILTISLFVKIVSYFVFPDHIRGILKLNRYAITLNLRYIYFSNLNTKNRTIVDHNSRCVDTDMAYYVLR